MKKGFGLLLLLLLDIFSFARADQKLPDQISNRARLEAAIDHANDKAYELYSKAPDSARNIAEEALLQSKKIAYNFGIARSYFNIGVICWSQSYYPIALFYENSALANTTPGHPALLSEIYCNMGRVYADLKNYKKALFYLDKSQALAGTDGKYLGETYSQKAYVYIKLKDYDRAIQQARLALKINLGVDKLGAAIAYSRLADIYYLKKDYAKSLAYNDTAYRESVKLHMNRLRAAIYLDYAKVNNDEHQFNKSIYFSERAIALYDSVGVISGLTNSYKTLIKSYEGENNLKQALIFERKYSRIQDSLNTVDKTKSTELIQNYFALNARLNSIAAMEERNRNNKLRIKQQDSIINTLVISLLIVIAALTVTYYFYRQKRLFSKKLQEHHEVLFDQKQLIQAQATNLQAVISLKDKMLAVVGHDLRTPIANLHNMLAMFDNEDLSVEEVQQLMRDINPVVKGAELTLINLLQWAGSQIKGQSVDITKVDIFLLGDEMAQTFSHLLKLKNIGFINQAIPGQLVLADENHIKVILRNLISNAIKFTERNGRIVLSAKVTGDKITIGIEDSGRGMSAEELSKLWDIGTHFSKYGTSGEQGTGIGLLLCKELIELNNSKLNVSSLPGKGSKFYFDLTMVK